MSGDVNDEEIYDDGTSITNIKVLGVKDKIAMFGPKPTVGNKPLPPALAKFHAMREDAGQGGTNVVKPSWKKPESPQSSEPSSAANKATPAWKKPSPASVDKDKNEPNKTVTTPSWKKPSPTSVNKDTNEPNKTVTTPSWKKPTVPSEKADENKTVTNTSTPPWKRSPGGQEKTTPAWKKPTPTTGKDSQPETDQNQNVPNVPAWKRQSNKVNIPNKFGGPPSPRGLQNVNIEEKPVNGTSPQPTSPSPSTTSSGTDSGQMFDPKALLRRTSTGDTAPKQITINPRQRLPDDGKTQPPPMTSPKSPSSDIPKHVTQSKTIVIRNGDGKKFEKLPKSSIITTDLKPIKPLKLLGSNVKDIIAEYIKAFEEYKNANEELYDDVGNYIKPSEEQEVYDDVGNTIEQRSNNRKSNRPVSEIPEMTEEEEMRQFGSASASGGSTSISGGSMQTPITEDIYDDAEQDELYEPLPEDEEVSAQEDKKEQERKAKEAADRKKKEDKERKEREKKEKAKLEKERKEKEKKEKEIRKKFKLTGDEKKSAEGVVRAKAKGGKLELAVEEGEIVDIIRMTENPAGKWLVMNKDGTYGYVESKNIDIAETAIKKAMKVVDTPVAMEGEFGPEEMYEDLDGFQQEPEEIYEECS